MTAWIGNTERVATKHYLQVTDDHFERSFDEYADANLTTMQDLGNLYTGVEYLRHIEGEKHIIYVSEAGMLLPRVEDDKSLAARANGVGLCFIRGAKLPDPKPPRPCRLPP